MKNLIVSVGRENADVVISSKGISRLHLTLEQLPNDKVRVTDNNSTNGTFVVKKVGKCSITSEVVDLDTSLLVGSHKTTPRELLEQIQVKHVLNKETNEQNSKKPLIKEPFSRYIRSDTGTFKDK
jgi:pSer/pThr/pTyr-binding forkhead associated (FHA) protein